MKWPPKFARIVEIIGEEAAWRIVRERGGVRLRVPIRTEPAQILAKLIGIDAATALSAEYGGDTIEVPRMAEFDRRRMEAEIAEAALQGVAGSQLARRYAMTERGIRKILARWRQPYKDLQTELF